MACRCSSDGIVAPVTTPPGRTEKTLSIFRRSLRSLTNTRASNFVPKNKNKGISQKVRSNGTMKQSKTLPFKQDIEYEVRISRSNETMGHTGCFRGVLYLENRQLCYGRSLGGASAHGTIFSGAKGEFRPIGRPLAVLPRGSGKLWDGVNTLIPIKTKQYFSHFDSSHRTSARESFFII